MADLCQLWAYKPHCWFSYCAAQSMSYLCNQRTICKTSIHAIYYLLVSSITYHYHGDNVIILSDLEAAMA